MGSRVVYYRGMRFEVIPEVYEPAEDTLLLADNLDVRKEERVLDLGTGCGLLAILAAKLGGMVIATDVSPKAIECAEINARTNHVEERVDFRLGDMFEPIGEERFDLIIFNPPYLPVPRDEGSDSLLSLAWSGGPNGRAIIDGFLAGLPRHLRSKGRAMFVQSTLSNVERTIGELEERGLRAEVVARKKLMFEELFLIRAESF
ncbi:MAG: methyltransferase [Hadesarchaea archaeon]|nr:methyltransferase [Hadesarchaea archaeon]